MSAYHISRLIGEARATLVTETSGNSGEARALAMLIEAVELMHMDNLCVKPATLADDEDTVLEG